MPNTAPKLGIATAAGIWLATEIGRNVVAVATIALVLMIALCWILNNTDRTARLTRLIKALRQPIAVSRKETPGP